MPNPYEPPEASPEPVPPAGGFRWRLIPAALMMALGGSLILASLVPLVWSLVSPGDATRLLGGSRSLGVLGVGVAGALWVAAGLGLWERRWWRAALCVVVGYGSGVLGSHLMQLGRPGGGPPSQAVPERPVSQP